MQIYQVARDAVFADSFTVLVFALVVGLGLALFALYAIAAATGGRS